MVDVILGLQWGDEGKGKIVDYFADRYEVIARFQGGPNAGHTLYVNDRKIILHTVPSGVFHPQVVNLIGNGVVLDPVVFRGECEKIASFGIDLKKNLFISEKAHLILPTHRALDKASEQAKGLGKIGSTLKGIGPAYIDKTGRNGLRVGDLVHGNFPAAYQKLRESHMRLLDFYGFTEDISGWEREFTESLELLRSMNLVNGEYFINSRLKEGKKVLAEGAQGSMLDVDFGTYPYVTSSSTISAGVCTGLGIPPQEVQQVIGVTKAYCTRVGSGAFPTELTNDTGELLRVTGSEFGSTTGRPRRCGWIDLVALKYACMISGVTQLVMTKSDVLDQFDPVKACTDYRVNDQYITEMPFDINHLDIQPVYTTFDGWQQDTAACTRGGELPQQMQEYIRFVETHLGIPIRYVSNGPGREQVLIRD
ncbi:MAG TPA: adenylosuccinate synthase [Chitinophagaceae bacterium]|nr:adenylosuccinate synthase [Chitinophagaceae bacterium]